MASKQGRKTVTINYDDLLTTEEKIEIVTKRLKGLAAEAYQYHLNKKGFTMSENGDAAEQVDAAIKALEALIHVHEQELSSLQANLA